MPRFLDTLLASPLPDGQQWMIANPEGFRYLSDLPGVGLVTAPNSFCTDWASIPRELWSILPPWGMYGPASIPHDVLYWEQALTREQCDDVLREASLLLGVEERIVDLIHTAVRTFGQASWDRNAALRRSGYRRMITGPDTPPYAGLTS